MLANNLLKGLTKNQKKEVKQLEMLGEWLVLFGKGTRQDNGLSKKDKTRIRKLTKQILANKDAQRSRT